MFNWLIARIIEPTEDTPPMMEDEDLYKYIINYHLSDRSTKSIKIMHGDVVIREGTKEDGVVNVIVTLDDISDGKRTASLLFWAGVGTLSLAVLVALGINKIK